ncbi:MAG: sugar-binding protein [Cytophagaceae bacterium]
MIFLTACGQKQNDQQSVSEISSERYANGNYVALYTANAPSIDGASNESEWNNVPWSPIDQVWLGEKVSPEDFTGRYKIIWDENHLYYLVEVVDNILSDQHPDPFDLWWEDDCLELFIDEDKSGGSHQFNHDAFAYHITLDYDVIDLGPDKAPHKYNDHLNVVRTKNGNTYTWEVAMKVFDKTFTDGQNNIPVQLKEGKKLGFAVSYNDNDSTNVRENFIGSIEIKGEDKNRGWIDSGIFGTLELVK